MLGEVVGRGGVVAEGRLGGAAVRVLGAVGGVDATGAAEASDGAGLADGAAGITWTGGVGVTTVSSLRGREAGSLLALSPRGRTTTIAAAHTSANAAPATMTRRRRFAPRSESECLSLTRVRTVTPVGGPKSFAGSVRAALAEELSGGFESRSTAAS